MINYQTIMDIGGAVIVAARILFYVIAPLTANRADDTVLSILNQLIKVLGLHADAFEPKQDTVQKSN